MLSRLRMSPILATVALLLASASGWKADILSDDPAVRGSVVARLHAKGRPGLFAVQDLVTHAPDLEARVRAVRALGELGDPDAEWALRAELRRPEPEVVAAAARAAAALRLDGLSKLLAARVGDPDAGLCAALGAAVSVFPSVAAAAHAAAANTSPQIQLAGLRVLAGAGVPVTADEARAALRSPLPEARLIAAQALAPIDPAASDAALEGLAVVTDPVGAEAAMRMARLGRPGLLRDLERLAAGKSAMLATRAIDALAGSPTGLAALLRLRAETPALAAEVDRAFGRRPPTTADLLAVLGDGGLDAAESAGKLLSTRADGLAALGHCLETLSPGADRCATGLAGGPGGAAVLDRALGSVDANVRRLAAWAIASSPIAPPLRVLSGLSLDPAPAVRAAAALGLGRRGAEGKPLLSVLVEDPDHEVRAAAAEQLAELLGPDELVRLVARSLDDDAVRPALIPALARLPSHAALSLILAELRRGNSVERRMAVEELSRFNDPAAFDALMQVASRDPDPGTRRRAAEILGN